MQDQKGFMWFGTKDGLNRFDGYNFKIFRNEPSNPNSIGSDFIRCITEDSNGTIWIGTGKGVFKFNPKTETFTFLKGSSDKEIRDIKADRKGNLWFISEYTLMRYHADTKSIKTFPSLEATSVSNIISDTIWVSTSGGTIERYQNSTDSFVSFDIFKYIKPASYKWIEKIYDTGKGYLLIGTSNQGIKIYNINTSTYTNLITYNTNKTEVFVRDFIHESGDTYWVATESN